MKNNWLLGSSEVDRAGLQLRDCIGVGCDARNREVLGVLASLESYIYMILMDSIGRSILRIELNTVGGHYEE